VTPDLDHENRTIVDLLREAIDGLFAVYRFGSTVGGLAHQGSDTDVAVLARAPILPSRGSRSRSAWPVALDATSTSSICLLPRQ
jgi:predicted nucleotidyltransferase